MNTVCLLLVSAGLAAAPASDNSGVPRRPNILWLIGENIGLDLGCYGEKLVRTPNLDRLAAEGVRYTRVFSTNPACAPSRSAFFTGMYQTTTDTHPMRSHRNDAFRLPPGVRPITHWLREAGYFTANIKTIGDRTVGTGKLDLNFVNEGPIYESDDWSALKSRQPFFAVVNSPEVEYDIYDRQSAQEGTRRVGRRARTSADRHAGKRHAAALLSRPSRRAAGMGPLPELRLRHGPPHRLGAGAVACRRAGGGHGHPVLRRQRAARSPRHPLVLRQRPARADDRPLAEALSRAAADQARRGQRPGHQPAGRDRHDAGHRRRAASAADAEPQLSSDRKPTRPASTLSAPATESTRRFSASARCATAAGVTSATSPPVRRSPRSIATRKNASSSSR